jgi:LmbE family N-acetylglucosaminyl deacetylase
MPLPLEAAPPAGLRVLFIVAHADDIEFGAAGSAARWVEAGAHVTYCIVTNGAAGSNDPAVTRDWLIAEREAEQRAAAAAVGVRDVCFLGYEDGTLEPTIALRRDLTRVIRQVRPDRIVILDPTTILVSTEGFDYINHPDHRAAAEAALYAIFPSAETRPIFPELLAEGLEPHHVTEVYLLMSERPNLAVDITPYFERKIAALLAHRSQVNDSIRDLIHGWDSGNAAQAGLDGVTYAETFRVLRFPVNVPGPIAPDPIPET